MENDTTTKTSVESTISTQGGAVVSQPASPDAKQSRGRFQGSKTDRKRGHAQSVFDPNLIRNF